MVANIIDKSVLFLIQQGAVENTEEQKEIYRYGMELQIYYIIHAAILISLGLLFGHGLEVALLLFFFGAIQVNAGGYHAKTHARCMSIMTIGVILFLLLLPIYQNNLILQLVSTIVGTATVITMSPVAHKNHPLSPQKSKVLGKRAKFIAVVLASLWCVLMFFDMSVRLQGIIPVVMAFTFVSLICAWTSKKICKP
ncbi:MAG: accessory gene regulator B family protein [Defluviitaleaceae bacterium]|nr:accessory gene regulator B family protein [Defluviitaleaceae bacterium]